MITSELKGILKPTVKIVYSTGINEEKKITATVLDQEKIEEILSGIFIRPGHSMMKHRITANASFFDSNDDLIGYIGCERNIIRPAFKGFQKYDYPLAYWGKFEFKRT